MSKRNYGQDCALAIGLDVIGERWTLLIVRALLTGPKRYSQLAEQLPAMGTNLLAARLKTLVEFGVIEKSSKAGYALTPRGEDLRPIVHALIRWGHGLRAERVGSIGVSRPEWDMLAIEAAFRPERWSGEAARIELTLDGYTFHIDIADGQARCREGPARDAAVCVQTSASVLLELDGSKAAIDRAIRRGDLSLSGSRRALGLLFKLFEL